jgi:hypothetical protein
MTLLLGSLFYRGPVWGGGDGGGSSDEQESGGGLTFYNTYDSAGNLTYSGTSREDAEAQAAIDSATRGVQDTLSWFEGEGSSAAEEERVRQAEEERARQESEAQAALDSARQSVSAASWSDPSNWVVTSDERGDLQKQYVGDLPPPTSGNYTVPTFEQISQSTGRPDISLPVVATGNQAQVQDSFGNLFRNVEEASRNEVRIQDYLDPSNYDYLQQAGRSIPG